MTSMGTFYLSPLLSTNPVRRSADPKEPEPSPGPAQTQALAPVSTTSQAMVPAGPTPSPSAAPSEPPALTLQPTTTTTVPPHPATQSFLPSSQSSEPLSQTLANPTSSTFTPQTATLASIASSATSGIFQPHQQQPTPAAAPTSLQSSLHPTATQSTTTPFSTFSPLGQTTNAPQTNTSQQLSHGLSQYSQHGLPTHVDSPSVPNAPQSHLTSQNQPLGSYYRQHDYGFTPANQSLLSQNAQQQQQTGQQTQQEQGGYSAFSNLAQSFNQGQDFSGFNEPRVCVFDSFLLAFIHSYYRDFMMAVTNPVDSVLVASLDKMTTANPPPLIKVSNPLNRNPTLCLPLVVKPVPTIRHKDKLVEALVKAANRATRLLFLTITLIPITANQILTTAAPTLVMA
jgi:hypothetical protein